MKSLILSDSNGRGAGISHPGAAEQEIVIRKAYANAKLDFGDTGYFEAHGTGTPVGDPLEVFAVGNVFSEGRSPEKPLLLGAVKSSLGHSEAASAIAQIIKVVLCLETGEIPATIGIKRLNPKIDFRGGRLRVVDAPTAWPTELPYRRASINSFGYGGANAHAVIDAADSYLEAHPELMEQMIPAVANGISCNGHTEQTNGYEIQASNGYHIKSQKSMKHVYVLAFSAHDEPTLRNNINAISGRADNYSISNLAYTIGCRRSLLSHRAFSVVSEDEVSSQLVDENVKFGVQKTAQTVIAFAFTGQGAQWPQMGYTLAKHFWSVRKTLQQLDCILGKVPNPPEWSILGTYHPLINR
jgi:acyl transferase domain-containing protein